MNQIIKNMVFQQCRLLFLIPLSLLTMVSCSVEKSGQQELKIAYVMAPGGTSHEAALKIGELVEKYTNGEIKTRIYPNAILGSDRILIEGLKLGSQDIVITGTALIGWYTPEYGLIEAPFLFRDYDHLDKVLHGEIGKELEQQIFDKCKLRFLAYLHRGSRYLTTTNSEIRTPEDLKGLKMRVPELPVYIKSWEIFGANPTPITYSDMFMALKQGVVDGQENPLEVVYTSHLYETQSYVMNTRHLVGFYAVAVADRFYKKYSLEHQKIIIKAVLEAAEYQNGLVQMYEQEYREKLEEHGVTFIDVDREAFEKLAKEKLPREFKDSWEPGVFERIVDVR
ncbi:MAG: TRAP transporter substrate-binding protein [Bacteroidota bacterium]